MAWHGRHASTAIPTAPQLQLPCPRHFSCRFHRCHRRVPPSGSSLHAHQCSSSGTHPFPLPTRGRDGGPLSAAPAQYVLLSGRLALDEMVRQRGCPVQLTKNLISARAAGLPELPRPDPEGNLTMPARNNGNPAGTGSLFSKGARACGWRNKCWKQKKAMLCRLGTCGDAIPFLTATLPLPYKEMLGYTNCLGG